MVALIVGYAIAVAAASCWVARGLRGPMDFLTGRRGLGIAHGIGLFGGIFLAATAVGIVGQGYQRGVAGAALDAALGVGFGVLGLTLLDRMRASPHDSLAALLRAHYGPWPGAIGMVLIAGSWLIMLSGFLAAAGVALGQLSGWPQATSIAVAVAILLLYAMPGGMRAVTATNFVHLAALAVLIGALCVLAAGHASAAVPVRHGSSSIGYVVGLLLISAPTTIVAPDVMMGMSSLRTPPIARRTLALVVLLLACGGIVLALLGARATHLIATTSSDNVLPDLINQLLPHGVAMLGLLALFGAALTGAVAEVMVCTFIVDEQITDWRSVRGVGPLGLTAIRLQMLAIAVLAGVVALADQNVVGLVVTAFRVFVPGIVPAAVLALLGREVRPGVVAASMLAGPAVCLGLAAAWPSLRDTPADPVLWGTLVAIAILAAGRAPSPSGQLARSVGLMSREFLRFADSRRRMTLIRWPPESRATLWTVQPGRLDRCCQTDESGVPMATLMEPTDELARFKQEQERLRESGVEYCLAAYVDVHGIPKCKAVPIDHFVGMMQGSELFTGAALDGLGQEPSDDELSVRPDLEAITVLPWEPTVAWAPGQLHFHDDPWPMDSRTVLRRQLARAAEHGLTFNLGIETEFFLVQRQNGTVVPANPKDTLAKAAYDVVGLLENMSYMDELIKYMNVLGFDVHSFDHEDANSQFEFDFSYTDAMGMADRLILWRMMTKTLARKYGCEATFMPKPYADRTGSGGHYNMSLADINTGENLFADPDDPRGCGVSTLTYQFIAGVLRHAAAICAVTASTVNSYKRLIKTGSMTGFTWAPVYVSYGNNNRTHMLRIPMTSPRVESRAVDMATNPYLGAAMMLAAGLEGIEHELDPGDPIPHNMYLQTDEELRAARVATLPRTLLEAVEAFDADPLSELVMGPALKQSYVELKKEEWWDYHNAVSEWELDRYLTFY